MDVLDEISDLKGVEGVVSRGRNTRIIDLVEGDILVDDDTFYKVEWGEVGVNSDGSLNITNGELVEVSKEALLGFTGTLFNLEDVK